MSDAAAWTLFVALIVAYFAYFAVHLWGERKKALACAVGFVTVIGGGLSLIPLTWAWS